MFLENALNRFEELHVLPLRRLTADKTLRRKICFTRVIRYAVVEDQYFLYIYLFCLFFTSFLFIPTYILYAP